MGALKSGAGSQRVVVPSAGGAGGGGSGRNQPFAGLLASSVPGPLTNPIYMIPQTKLWCAAVVKK